MKTKIAVLTMLVFLVLHACTSASMDITGEWRLVSFGDTTKPTPSIPNVDTLIKFDSGGRLNGNVGCNSFGGNYEISGDKITFSSTMSTMMYCEKTSEQEQALLGIFSDNLNLQIQMNGDTMSIASFDRESVVNLARK